MLPVVRFLSLVSLLRVGLPLYYKLYNGYRVNRKTEIN